MYLNIQINNPKFLLIENDKYSPPPRPPTSVTITFMTSKNLAYILSNFNFFTSSNNEKSLKKLTYV